MNDPRLTPWRDDKSLVAEEPALTGEEDQLLITSLSRWLNSWHVGSNRRAVAAVRHWMDVKGLND